MAREVINTGTVANDGTGEPVRNAYIKVNNMTNEIYTALGNGSLLNATIAKVGNPSDNQVAIWTGDGTLEGTANLIFDEVTTSLGIGKTPAHVLDIASAIPRLAINDNSGNVGTGIIDNRIRMDAGGSRAFEIGYLTTSNGQVSLRNFVAGDMSFRITGASANQFRFEENNGATVISTFDATGISVGPSAPLVSIDAGNSTDAIETPKGTVAQRPTNVSARVRYNTDTSAMEAYAGSLWQPVTSYDVTFTPELADDNAAGNVATVTTTYGRATRIGNLVTITMRFLGIDTTGMVAGNDIWLRGIPAHFQAHNDLNSRYYGSAHVENTSFTNAPVAFVNETERQSIRLVEAAPGGLESILTIAALTSTTANVAITISYNTNTAT